jgi:hypothetical protein
MLSGDSAAWISIVGLVVVDDGYDGTLGSPT